MFKIGEMLEGVRSAKMFSSLDSASGYHKIRMIPDDEPKTAFTVPGYSYQVEVLPSGPTHAPATFQHAMNKLSAKQSAFVTVWSDDILIFSENAEDHVKQLQEVLQLLEDDQLHRKLGKSEFKKKS